jgi:hypothetical protein
MTVDESEYQMPLEQALRDTFWNPATFSSLPGFVLSLAVSAALAVLVGQVYIRFGQSLSNRRLFARNFLLVAVTTTLIITIVKSSLALSLGLVGALSIVRFRAAIKEPEELAYLFLAISVGLGLGAGQALLTLVALALILGFVVIRGLMKPSVEQPNLFLTISTAAGANLGASDVLDILRQEGASAGLKRFDEGPDLFEAAFVVDFKTAAAVEAASRRFRERCPDVRVSCLDDRGLGV